MQPDRLAGLITEKSYILERAGIDDARVEIELILCHLLEVDRLGLYLDGPSRIDRAILRRLDEIIERRATRYPLQYVLGESWFYGRKFFVSQAVMVPTPETEILCETALGYCRHRNYRKPRLLELGTGSGVIAVTMACELEDCDIVALEISPEAIEVALRNARSLGADDKIAFRQSEYFSAVLEGERFDLILSNPPYIANEDYGTLPPEVLADPKQALLAGTDGMDVINVILQEAPPFLAESGRIMFEIGFNQAGTVERQTEADMRYTSLTLTKDLNDIDRVVVLACEK
jgi:release factor glutamine methyltransferase